MYQSGGQLRGRPEESPRPLSSQLCRLGNWLRDASPPPRPLVATSRQGLGPKFDSDLWVTLVEVGSSPWDISSTYFGGRSSKISFCQSSKDGNPVLQYVNLSQPRFTTVSFFAQKSDYRALIKCSVYTCPRGSPSPLFCNHWSGKIPHAMGKISLCTTSTEPVLCSKRIHLNEKPAHHNWRGAAACCS